MWHFALRMILIIFISAIGLKCLSIGTFGPMFTGSIIMAVVSGWILIELILAVEQIVNAYRASNEEIIDPNEHDPY